MEAKLDKVVEHLENNRHIKAQKIIDEIYKTNEKQKYIDICNETYEELALKDKELARKFKIIYLKNSIYGNSNGEDGANVSVEESKEKSNEVINSEDRAKTVLKTEPDIDRNEEELKSNISKMELNRRVYKKSTSLILCGIGFFGINGMHKFYEDKIILGIIYFLTAGLFFIGTTYDFIKLLTKDKYYTLE